MTQSTETRNRWLEPANLLTILSISVGLIVTFGASLLVEHDRINRLDWTISQSTTTTKDLVALDARVQKTEWMAQDSIADRINLHKAIDEVSSTMHSIQTSLVHIEDKVDKIK